MTSHAAVVARGMGKPCVAGVEGAQIDAGRAHADGRRHGRPRGRRDHDRRRHRRRHRSARCRSCAAELDEDFDAIATWADERRRLRVRANADTPEDAARAREFGAEGIGLCRTEHMFMAEERLPVVREMILADAGRAARARRSRSCCRCSRPTSRGSSRAMAGLPVTIRLLDPPLHEFLPDRIGARRRAARCAEPGAGARPPRAARRARPRRSHEQNPMLGTRGCRLGARCIPRSTRCRCGRSCAARSPRARARRGRRGRDHDPAGRPRRGAAAHARAGRGDDRRGARGAGASSRSRSAR